MLIDFFLHLKASRLPVSIKEFLTLLEALQQHVIEYSLDDFYVLSRAILVKDETNFDKFDRAFGEYFKGVGALPGVDVLIPEAWLRRAGKKHLTDAERDLPGRVFDSADYAEGTRAFLGKREPRFDGR